MSGKMAGLPALIGGYLPQCSPEGDFEFTQCHGATGYCWCVNPATGKEISGTKRGPTQPMVACKGTLNCLNLLFYSICTVLISLKGVKSC